MRPPNILLINCDDTGVGDLGCYGSTVNDTPHLDRLAAGGTRFTDFAMASAVCSPSRSAMLTGCYPTRIDCTTVHFPASPSGLNPSETTIASLLRTHGYATAMVGKWHCGDQPEFLPTRHGFDSWYGLPYSNDMGLMHVRPDARVPLPLMLDETVLQLQPDQTCLTERYVEQCTRFMRASSDRPFFLYLAHLHTHLPHLTSHAFLSRSRNGAYGAAVATIDWAMGALLDELRRLRLEDDTLILFTSDNGSRARGEGGSNGPFRGHKAQVWEGGFRVPFIASWPGRIPAGRTSDAQLTGIDLLPTLASIAGVPMPTLTIDGVDASALLLGTTSTSPRETFAYWSRDELAAVRSGRWKIHVGRSEAVWRPIQPARELYDLADDPGETTDLAASRPDVVARLEALAEDFRAELGDAATGRKGRAVRPCGRVANPRPLATHDPDHPYIIAMYDGDAG